MESTLTDPPYGVEYDPTWRNQAEAAKTKRTGILGVGRWLNGRYYLAYEGFITAALL